MAVCNDCQRLFKMEFLKLAMQVILIIFPLTAQSCPQLPCEGIYRGLSNEFSFINRNGRPVETGLENTPGHFQLLEIKIISAFGFDAYLRQFAVIISNHWDEKWIFRLSLTILLGGVLLGYALSFVCISFSKNELPQVRFKSRTPKLEVDLVTLKKSEEELKRQLNIQNKLIVSLSHDIRTPMKYAIAGARRIEYLIEQMDLSEALQQARNMGSAAQMMSSFFENTLHYIKTKYYIKQISFHEIALRDLINDKIKLFYPAGAEQLNHFSNEVGEAINVFSNDQLLGIMLHNLIDNANKNTYRGQIRFFTERHQEYIHLIISDTGPGFSEAVLAWMQGSRSTEKKTDGQAILQSEGDGLGLIMVQEIADLLHVDLLAENTMGAKVTLIFTIE